MTSLLFIFAAGAAMVWSAPPAVPAFRCSIDRYRELREPSKTFFVGSAQPDTVLAGPGSSLGDHAGSGRHAPLEAAPIFGQVVQVRQLAGNDSSALALAFAKLGVREVIVVPWGLDRACAPIPWTATARWVETADPGFYRVTARPAAEWVNGRPVLDAVPGSHEPYPNAGVFRRGHLSIELAKGPSLTAEQYFGLHAALPDMLRTKKDRAGALQALDAWERDHPELARTYPAPEVIYYARHFLRDR